MVAPVKFAPDKLACLKFIVRKSRYDKSAPDKLTPWKNKEILLNPPVPRLFKVFLSEELGLKYIHSHLQCFETS